MYPYKYIKSSLLNISGKIKNFLFSKGNKEFLVFLCFLFVAAAFWFIRVLNDDYVVELKVPIQLCNVPNNIIVTQNLPSELTVRIRDKGNVLLGYELEKSLSPIQLNFSDYNKQHDQHIIISGNDLDRFIIPQLNNTTRILSVKPEKMDLYFSKGESKLVPIKITGDVEPDHQYYISDTLAKPVVVRAYAPKEILKNIRYAYTQPLVLKNINGTACHKVALRSVYGVKFIPSNVTIAFTTDVYCEKKVVIPIQGIRFPKGKHLLTFPQKVTVSFQIGSSLSKAISEKDFAIEIPYEKLMSYDRDKYPISLSRWPVGIRNIQIYPSEVDFLMEQNSLQ